MLNYNFSPDKKKKPVRFRTKVTASGQATFLLATGML